MKNARREPATALADWRNPTPPEQPIAGSSRELLIKAHKQSQKTRWTDHFTLQLRAEGFLLLPFQEHANGNLPGLSVITAHDPKTIVVPEFRFHPTRLWRFDFAIPAAKVACEIEGGVWRVGGGAHSHPVNIMRDVEKGNEAVLHGWRVLRFTDKEIRAGVAVPMLKKLLMI